MADRNVYPVEIDSFIRLIEAAGYGFHHRDDERGRLTLDIQGEQTVLRVHVVVGKAQDGATPWYARLLSYSLDFEPARAGVPRERLLAWLNNRNSELLFGRYYYDEKTDTVAFEVGMPCNGGILGEDFDDLLRIATISVDGAHADLKALAEGC